MDHKNPPALGRAVLQPLFHTPESAPTIDTPPQSLGIQDSSTEDLDRAGNADLSASGRVRRAVEKTVDKLGRTKSLATKARAQSPNPNSGPLRRFSLHRGKGTHTPSSVYLCFSPICRSYRASVQPHWISPTVLAKSVQQYRKNHLLSRPRLRLRRNHPSTHSLQRGRYVAMVTL